MLLECATLLSRYQSASLSRAHRIQKPYAWLRSVRLRKLWFWRAAPNKYLGLLLSQRASAGFVCLGGYLHPPNSQIAPQCTNTALYRGWYNSSARVGALRLPVLNCPAAHATNCFTTGERRDIFTRIIINIIFCEILTFLDPWDHIIPGPIDQRSGNQDYAYYLAFSSLQWFFAGLTYWSSDLIPQSQYKVLVLVGDRISQTEGHCSTTNNLRTNIYG